MALNLVLQVDDTEIRFFGKSGNWCRCQLASSDGIIDLGAERPSALLPRIRMWLLSSGQGSCAGKIAEIDVSWICSMSEKHYVFYGAVDGEDKILFITNADANPLSPVKSIQLFIDDQKRWIAQLRTAEMWLSSKEGGV